MDDVNFSIVGCGRIGTRHAEHISRLARLNSICDVDEQALQILKEKYPHVNVYHSIDELLEYDKDSQVINICTPNGLHAEHTIKALRADRHVVCEKPMALTVKDAEQMIGEAHSAHKHLFIVKQNRFNPPVQKVKEVLNNGLLGKIYSAQINCFWNRNERYYHDSPWKGTKNLDGGILFTQFSHFIDILLWFLGEVDLNTIAAFSENFSHKDTIEFEDTLVAVFKFKNGTLATINCTINSFNKNMEGSVTLFGEKGTVKIGGQYLNVLEYQNIENFKIEEIKEHRPANDYGYYQGSMSNHDKVIENVLDVLKHNGKVAVNGYEGLKTVEIIEHIYNSLDRKEVSSTVFNQSITAI